MVLNNGAIIDHNDKIGVVDLLTSHTYEQSKRHLHDHSLIVGEAKDLEEHMSNEQNIDIPEGI